MVSEKQHLANIENAKLGGVKTAEGKAISKYNAITHGIFNLARTEYEEHMHEDILSDLFNELNPVGILESILVERIALCYLRLYRIAKVEGDNIRGLLEPYFVTRTVQGNDFYNSLLSSVEKVTVHGYKPRIDSDAIRQIEQTIMRYDTTVENKLYKALHELQRLQAKRKGLSVPVPVAIDIIDDSENKNK